MQTFFSDLFGRAALENASPTRNSSGFYQFFNGTVAGTRGFYSLVLTVFWAAAGIMFVIYFIMLFMSRKGRTRDQAKDKIMTAILAVALSSMAVGVVIGLFSSLFA